MIGCYLDLNTDQVTINVIVIIVVVVVVIVSENCYFESGDHEVLGERIGPRNRFPGFKVGARWPSALPPRSHQEPGV